MNFTDLAFQLFPDLTEDALDELEYTRNPDIPEDISELLDEVSCQTGVPKNWLEKSARLVLNGLAGCRCLWYLHGCGGSIQDQSAFDGPKTNDTEFRQALKKEAHRREKKLRQHDSANDNYVTIVPHWNAGYVEVQEFKTADEFNANTPTRVRKEKIGGLLNKLDVSDYIRSSWIHEFETRTPESWDWKISAHPFDVLTMSYRRPWTSCMRPPDPEGRDIEARSPGVAQLGPLTDMAAGSAIMFFYRPGAGTPCGRLVLRPYLGLTGYVEPEVEPCISQGVKTYGSAPGKVDSSELQRMLAEQTGADTFVSRIQFCEKGEDGRALTRYIYSDSDRVAGLEGYCEQDDFEYELAYAQLIEANWPEPALEFGDMYNRAEGLRELVEVAPEKNGEREARSVADVLAYQRDNMLDIIRMWSNPDDYANVILDEAEAQGVDFYNERDKEAMVQMVLGRFEELIDQQLAQMRTEVLILSGESNEHLGYTIPNYFIDDLGLDAYDIPTFDMLPNNTQSNVKTAEDDIKYICVYPEEFSSKELIQKLENTGIIVEILHTEPGEMDWSNWRDW